MNIEKEKLLNDAYQKVIQTSLYDMPLNVTGEFIDKNVMGYGTAVNEKILSLSEYLDLIEKQREQGANIKMNFDFTPVHRKILADENSAIFVDEALIKMFVNGDCVEMFLRLSMVFEYSDSKWILIHFHSSKPEYEDGGEDTWHIKEWKQKNDELQRKVDEQTAELLSKNRELEIETSLERVRARAMAMHSSEDLALTVDLFFKELNGLNIKPRRCGVGVVDANTRIVDVTSTTASENKDGDKILIGKLKLADHPVLDKIYEHWQLQQEYFPVLRGNEIKEYYQIMNPQIEFPNFSEDEIQYGYYFFFKEGGVFVWTEKEFNEDELNIFRKFKSVLSLTYRRYIDLKEAEAQAREAQIEAALERVRAKAMSMRSSDELIDVANEMRAQMGKLGQPDLEVNAIQLYNPNSDIVDSWYALRSIEVEDPKIITGQAFFGKESSELMREMVAGYESSEIDYTLEASGGKMMEFFNELVKAIPDMLKYIGGEMPDKVYYHLSDFSGGSLVMVSYQPPSEETKTLQRRAASVFDLAFTRYLDLKNAEEQNKIIQAENERKTNELEEARNLQLGMLPKELPEVDNLDIAVYMKTATEVGGDYYDFSVKEDGTLNIGLGDATGHGMKAGTVVSMMKSLFTGNSVNTDIEEFFYTSNKALKNSMLERMMFGFIMINVNRSKVTFINAGMPPLYIYKADKKTAEEISVHGLPLGAMNKTTYECNVLTVAKDDVILILTDGLPELQNGNDEMYGYERLKNMFEKNALKSADKIVESLKDECSKWADHKDPEDDVSFIVLKFK